MTNLKAVPETTDLPDDPRECCRQIIDCFRTGMDHPTVNLPSHYARLSRTVMEATRAAEWELEPCIPALAAFAVQAEDAADAYHDAIERAWSLARHGAGDHRGLDASLAERWQALEEGREPPYEPTGFEVRGVMVAAKAAGRTMTEAEAIELLKANPPEGRA